MEAILVPWHPWGALPDPAVLPDMVVSLGGEKQGTRGQEILLGTEWSLMPLPLACQCLRPSFQLPAPAFSKLPGPTLCHTAACRAPSVPAPQGD